MLRTGAQPGPSDELSALFIDVDVVLEALPPGLRELCRRLKDEPVTGISCDTGVPRGTSQESIKKIREIFDDPSLKEYL